MQHVLINLIFIGTLIVHSMAGSLDAQTISPEQKSADQTEEPTPLRVLTYNIKRGLGNDGKTDIDRTADRISQLKPDIVALQEVDQLCGRSGRVDQPAKLGERLKMQPGFGPFMEYDGGLYGLATLSRFAVLKTTSLNLPEGNEPRVALATYLRVPSGETIVVVNIHFDWVRDDKFRFAQAKAVKNYLNGIDHPFILLGDFNDQPDSRTLKLFSESLLEADKPNDDRFTFSAEQPKLEIDFIFASPADRWQIKSVKVIEEPIVSDHRPVLSELILLPKSDQQQRARNQ